MVDTIAVTGVVSLVSIPSYTPLNAERMKKVYEFKTTQLEPKKLEVIVRCQGGCYVKELCNGDDGRTTPSLSELLKTQVNVLELDVLHVD